MKQEFKQIGKSFAAAAAEIGCSKTALINAVHRNEWPKKGADELRRKLKQFFETNGADIPAGLRNEPEAAPAPNPLKSEDNDMLLRKATLTQAARRHFGLPRDRTRANPLDSLTERDVARAIENPVDGGCGGNGHVRNLA